MRTILIAALLLIAAAAAAAAMVDDLYQTQTLVTGQGEPNRLLGFGRCLRDALVKVSGDLRLADDPRVDALAQNAAPLVRGFRYRDLLAGIPIHDEQGSRDRPYELTVDFEPAKIDEALRNLGSAAWGADRPRVAIFVGVRSGASAYLLAGNSNRGIDQREALASAAKLRGLPVILPSVAAFFESGMPLDNLASADPAALDAAAKRAGGDLALAGRMVWSDRPPGWVADWRLVAAGKVHEWRTYARTFDETFRRALGGVTQILSGHGEPN